MTLFGRSARVLACWILAGIFIWSGLEKLRGVPDFAQAVAHYRLLPWWGAKLMAVVLPVWEIAAGLALVFPRWRTSGALITSGLSLMFLAAILSALIRGLNIPCGCFGNGPHPADWASLSLDAAILGLSLWIWLGPVPQEPAHSPK